jgi:hypothetical protein
VKLPNFGPPISRILAPRSPEFWPPDLPNFGPARSILGVKNLGVKVRAGVFQTPEASLLFLLEGSGNVWH